MITWEEYIRAKDADAFKRMYTELLLVLFNDILPCEHYQYNLVKWLEHKDKSAKMKLDKHNSSIEWLLTDSKERALCFQVLDISDMRKEQIVNAISAKFNNPKRFFKFFTSYANEYGKSSECQNSHKDAEENLNDTKSRE